MGPAHRLADSQITGCKGTEMSIRRSTLLLAAIALAVSLACSRGADPAGPVSTPRSLLPTGTAVPSEATPEASTGIAQYSLPTRDVPFAVDTPAGTTGPVWVRVFGVSQWEFVRSVELTSAGGDRWTGSVPLEEGALVRYTYDRGDLAEVESLLARREAPAIGLDTVWRIAHVAPELSEVRDTVAMWADAPAAVSTGSVSGLVTDALSGLPVMDAEVSIAGMHTATDFDGRYQLEGVAAGEQRVTIHRATGDYLSTSAPVTVATDEMAQLPLEVTPARPLTVQIQALLPEGLPPEAEIKIYGNAWQTGGRFQQAPGQPEGLALPVSEPVRRYEGERVHLSLDLYEGQPISYRYTLAGAGQGAEVRLDGDQTPRSFIASRANRVRVDQIEAFRPPDAVEVVLRVQVPDNTPDDVPVQFSIGPSYWMTPDADGGWTTVLYARAGETLRYALRLGDGVEVGADDSPEALDGFRTVEVPAVDLALGVAVTDWVGLPGVSLLRTGQRSTVRFRVSVVAGSTEGSKLHVIGDDDLAGGIELTPVAGDPTLFEGEATLPAGRYEYEIWRNGGSAPPVASAVSRTLDVRFTEHTVNDWVSAWSSESPTGSAREQRFRGGYYLPDFWSPGFAALTDPTFDTIEGRPGDLVALSSVWGYGQIRPEPIVEPRSRLAASVATPLEALLEQGKLARRADVPVMLAPQFNMEQTVGGSVALAGPKSQQWIDGWLREAERLWLWNADVAQAINAEALLLPGPTFHVFDQPDWFPSEQSFEAFDQALLALIDDVRQRYDGRLLISGTQTALAAPGVADMVGVTSFDIGHPALGPTATVEEWRDGYEVLLSARLDPIHGAWEQPVFIYQLQVPSHPTEADPSGEYTQARQLEGMMQALASRTWVVGALSWSYQMFDTPAFAGDGLRGRLAESVLRKHFELFNPDEVPGFSD